MPSIRRRVLVPFVTACVAGSTLTACATTIEGSGTKAAGDFFTPSPSPTTSAEIAGDLVSRAREALLLGGDVAIDGGAQGDDVTIDVTGRYSNDGCSAVVRVGALRLEVREVADQVFVQAPNAFWVELDEDHPGAAAVTSEQWVKVEDTANWPAFYGTTVYVQTLVLPDPSLDLETDGEAAPGGEHAVLVSDEDGWQYTILDQLDDPRVVHLEQDAGSSYDVTYPTDDVEFVAPAADLVVSIGGF